MDYNSNVGIVLTIGCDFKHCYNTLNFIQMSHTEYSQTFIDLII